jgi:hypothetical protein
MEKFFSKVNLNELAHMIVRLSDFSGRTNVVNEKEFLQVSTLQLSAGESFMPHIHLWKEIGGSTNVAQESWVVIKGKIECSFYDVDGQLLAVDFLNEGDCSISLYGGHSYRAMSDAIVYEFKNGPYLGQEKDKKFVV